MDDDDPLDLSAGSLHLVLSHSIGGSISAFDWTADGTAVPILRKSNSLSESVLDAGSFPLVPFVNRVRGGAFAFRGRNVRLAPNMAGDASPLHGQGWLAPWRVEIASASRAELSFEYEPGDWPWAYEARQVFELDDRGLSLRLSCRNIASEPMPCGLGQHPYFFCGPGTRIDTAVEHVWTIDEHVLPVERIDAAGRFDLRDRKICGQDLDHGFGGWSGQARLSDPEWPFEVEISSPTARFFQVYSPATGGFFVAEPVSHANAALNASEEQWPELGLTVLEPGEMMNLDVRIEVRGK